VKLLLNGELRETADKVSLAEFLAGLNLSITHVAVELNLEVVPRTRYAETILREGDRLEVVTLVGGG
jgi:sulfur carrier protein